MIKRFFIITVLLFGVTMAFGQSRNSDAANEAAPKTALLQAQKDYQKAVKEKNSPLLIQSLIRQIKYQSLINSDSILRCWFHWKITSKKTTTSWRKVFFIR